LTRVETIHSRSSGGGFISTSLPPLAALSKLAALSNP